MEKWKEDLIEEAADNAEKTIERMTQNLEANLQKVRRAYNLKKRVIEALRQKPNAVFGDDAVYIHTKSHLLVHDVAKELGITLERSGEFDGFNFKGSYEGIHVCVYGMTEVPHCKIVPKKIMKEVIEYEVICNEEGK